MYLKFPQNPLVHIGFISKMLEERSITRTLLELQRCLLQKRMPSELTPHWLLIRDPGRDDEREYDGHIPGSLHFASADFDDTLPQLWPAIRGKKAVIMHCALSQVCPLRCNGYPNPGKLLAASLLGSMQWVPKWAVYQEGKKPCPSKTTA